VRQTFSTNLTQSKYILVAVTGAVAKIAFGIVSTDDISPHPIPNMVLLPMTLRTTNVVSSRMRNMTGVGKEDLRISKVMARCRKRASGKLLTGELHPHRIFEEIIDRVYI
jgi:hypothetical protein